MFTEAYSRAAGNATTEAAVLFFAQDFLMEVLVS
jgi:hypothetical protein